MQNVTKVSKKEVRGLSAPRWRFTEPTVEDVDRFIKGTAHDEALRLGVLSDLRSRSRERDAMLSWASLAFGPVYVLISFAIAFSLSEPVVDTSGSEAVYSLLRLLIWIFLALIILFAALAGWVFQGGRVSVWLKAYEDAIASATSKARPRSFFKLLGSKTQR